VLSFETGRQSLLQFLWQTQGTTQNRVMSQYFGAKILPGVRVGCQRSAPARLLADRFVGASSLNTNLKEIPSFIDSVLQSSRRL
jgi:hypothetical protein